MLRYRVNVFFFFGERFFISDKKIYICRPWDVNLFNLRKLRLVTSGCSSSWALYWLLSDSIAWNVWRVFGVSDWNSRVSARYFIRRIFALQCLVHWCAGVPGASRFHGVQSRRWDFTRYPTLLDVVSRLAMTTPEGVEDFGIVAWKKVQRNSLECYNRSTPWDMDGITHVGVD